MKHYVLIFFIFLLGSMSFAAPDYNPNHKTITYDTSYNIALWNKLKTEYDKKCWVYKSDGSHNICGTNSFYKMVQVPYDLNKLPDEATIIKE